MDVYEQRTPVFVCPGTPRLCIRLTNSWLVTMYDRPCGAVQWLAPDAEAALFA